MTKYFFSILLLFAGNFVLGQSIYPFEEIKLNKPSDYKDAEPLALTAASFLLSTPFKEKDINRTNATGFLQKWIMGTKDYSFRSGVAQDLADDHDLLDLFSAAMVKFCLENKTLAANAKLIEISASKSVLTYCDDPINNFKLKKRQRKILASD